MTVWIVSAMLICVFNFVAFKIQAFWILNLQLRAARRAWRSGATVRKGGIFTNHTLIAASGGSAVLRIYRESREFKMVRLSDNRYRLRCFSMFSGDR